MNNFLTVFKMMVKSINLGNSSNSKKRRITLSFWTFYFLNDPKAVP